MLFVASFQTVIDKCEFLLGFAYFPLFFYKQSISILECVFSAAIEGKDYLRPFLFSVVALDQRKQLDILLDQPWSFLQSWIQKAVPMLSALLGTSEHFIASAASLIKLLSHCLPIEA